MITFKQHIQEKLNKVYKYSSVQLNITGDISKKMISLGEMIPDSELTDDGREDETHITVKYGFTNNVSQEDIENVVSGFGPVSVVLGKVSLFEAPKFDVIKIDIKSKDLLRLNKKISVLPNEDTHPVYHPHATIAYVKSGIGQKYINALNLLEGTSIEFGVVVFSINGNKIRIPLG